MNNQKNVWNVLCFNYKSNKRKTIKNNILSCTLSIHIRWHVWKLRWIPLKIKLRFLYQFFWVENKFKIKRLSYWRQGKVKFSSAKIWPPKNRFCLEGCWAHRHFFWIMTKARIYLLCTMRWRIFSSDLKSTLSWINCQFCSKQKINRLIKSSFPLFEAFFFASEGQR